MTRPGKCVGIVQGDAATFMAYLSEAMSTAALCICLLADCLARPR